MRGCKTMGKGPIYNEETNENFKMAVLLTKIGPNQFIFHPSMHNITLKMVYKKKKKNKNIYKHC